MLSYPIVALTPGRLDELVDTFHAARPFPHVVIDNFLDEDFAARLIDELPALADMEPSRIHMFGDRHTDPMLEEHSDAAHQLHKVMAAAQFTAFLSRLVGAEVFLDPSDQALSYHAGPEGSYLEMHLDPNLHATRDDWVRRLTFLLYLNPGWDPSWGGELLITDDLHNTPRGIAPLFNRLVIMECSQHSFHGYQRINFPPGRTRSLVMSHVYAAAVSGSVRRRGAVWVPSSGGPVRRLVATNFLRLISAKAKLLGAPRR